MGRMSNQAFLRKVHHEYKKRIADVSSDEFKKIVIGAYLDNLAKAMYHEKRSELVERCIDAYRDGARPIGIREATTWLMEVREDIDFDSALDLAIDYLTEEE